MKVLLGLVSKCFYFAPMCMNQHVSFEPPHNFLIKVKGGEYFGHANVGKCY